jgi:hypothetical protein
MIITLTRAGYIAGSRPTGWSKDFQNKWDQKLYDQASAEALKDLDLASRLSWPLRDQIAVPACTAYAAMACVELSIARKAQTTPERLSAGAAYFYMKDLAEGDMEQPIRSDAPGYTRFKDAVSYLKTTGYYNEAKWNDSLVNARPSTIGGPGTILADVCYHSYPLPENDQSFPPDVTDRPRGIARAIYDELAAGRPVGAGFPAYARLGGHGMTNWTSAFENGVVPVPRTGDTLDMDAGHAVCIVGFTTGGKPLTKGNINQGLFVFRNSFGETFASAPTTGWPQGYGTVSADLVETCCWEVMFMRQPSPNDPQGEEQYLAAA